MKNIFTIASILFFGPFNSIGQALLRGVVTTINNVPLEDVSISSPSLASKVYTNSDGFFEMEFPNCSPGQPVTLIVRLDGYLPVDPNALKQVFLRYDPNLLIFINLEKKSAYNNQLDLLSDMILNHMDSITVAHLNPINIEIKNIETKIENNVISNIERASYQDSIKILRERAVDLERKNNQIIRLLGMLSEGIIASKAQKGSPQGQIADSLAKKGDFYGAIGALSPSALRFNDSVALNLVAIANEVLRSAVNDHMHLALYFIASGKFDEAENEFESALKLDSTDISVLFQYTLLLATQNKNKKALLAAEWGFRQAKTAVVQSSFLNFLGILYFRLENSEKSQNYFEKSIELRRTLADFSHEGYDSMLGDVLNNLGVLFYRLKKEFGNAENVLLEALNIRRRLARVNNTLKYKEDVSTTLNNLGNMYRIEKKFTESQSCHLEALELREKLTKLKKDLYEDNLTESLNNIGNLYRDMKELKLAENTLLRAVTIRKKLVEYNPSAYEGVYAGSLHNLGVVYYDKGDYEKAKYYLLEAKKIRYKLFADFNAIPESLLADSENSIGNLFRAKRDYKESQIHFAMALEIQYKYFLKKAEPYKLDIAQTLNNAGYLFIAMDSFSIADSLLNKALSIYLELTGDISIIYKPELAKVKSNLGTLYTKQGRLKEALPYLEEAIVIRKYWSEKYPKIYLESYVYDLLSLGILNILMGRYEAARGYLQTAQLKDPKNNMVYYYWGCYFASLKNNRESFKCLEKAVRLGFKDEKMFLNEKCLLNLKAVERYEKLLSKIKAPITN